MSNFSFDIDVSKKAMVFSTKDQERLEHITRRMSGVKAQALLEECDVTEEAAELEVARLEAAFEDVKKRMSKAEFVEYEEVVEAHKPKELSPEELAARYKQMEQNKDRPSH